MRQDGKEAQKGCVVNPNGTKGTRTRKKIESPPFELSYLTLSLREIKISAHHLLELTGLGLFQALGEAVVERSDIRCGELRFEG